jgi:hypothetical protein
MKVRKRELTRVNKRKIKKVANARPEACRTKCGYYFVLIFERSGGCSSQYSDGLLEGRTGFDSREGPDIFLYSTVCRPALERSAVLFEAALADSGISRFRLQRALGISDVLNRRNASCMFYLQALFRRAHWYEYILKLHACICILRRLV